MKNIAVVVWLRLVGLILVLVIGSPLIGWTLLFLYLLASHYLHRAPPITRATRYSNSQKMNDQMLRHGLR
ncbi:MULTISPECIES: hypothetical protein [Listeriaceae]|uniref:hypothetical protein n=1 Tax=Listeria TaxID=1637 RepID=UPI000F60155C|nr:MULTISPECIES: hypothetical protein [Listeria]WAO23080.1 hypothetical protein OTR81_07385 [Listeria newyorkensis]